MNLLRSIDGRAAADLFVDYGAYIALGFAIAAFISVLATHPDRKKRGIRRSIRLGFPKEDCRP